ncbi:MAG: peptide chain release factor 1 [Planctomycetes bacterium]|nr:peptide chain release factor 1 [Planctomycetota bacterium]
MSWETVAQKRFQRYSWIQEQLMLPEVATNPNKFAKLIREAGMLKETALGWERFEKLRKAEADAREMLEDPEMAEMAEEEIASTTEQLEKLEDEIKSALVTGDEDSARNAIVEIRAGVGGEEAALFAGDLLRMYQYYAGIKGWKIEIIDISHADVGGLKDVTFNVIGDNVFKLMRLESGGHRVQRVPETEAQGRIHTSMVTVAVLPEAEEVEVNIDKKDIREDVMRASGPGGQKVNKTESAVRLTHLPTGIVVICMDEKSQHRNRDRAMKVLVSRLYDKMKRDADAERASNRKTQIGSGDRSERIRTYNFPQGRCTDHRLGQEHNQNVDAVMLGKLGPLHDALLDLEKWQKLEQLDSITE